MSLLASTVSRNGGALTFKADRTAGRPGSHYVSFGATTPKVTESSLARRDSVMLRRGQRLQMARVDATFLLADVMKMHSVRNGLAQRVVRNPVSVGGDRIPGRRPSSIPDFPVAETQGTVPPPAAIAVNRDFAPKPFRQARVSERHTVSIYSEGMTPANWVDLTALGT